MRKLTKSVFRQTATARKGLLALPTELLETIFDYCYAPYWHRPSLLEMCLICRTLLPIARKILYHDIDLLGGFQSAIEGQRPRYTTAEAAVALHRTNITLLDLHVIDGAVSSALSYTQNLALDLSSTGTPGSWLVDKLSTLADKARTVRKLVVSLPYFHASMALQALQSFEGDLTMYICHPGNVMFSLGQRRPDQPRVSAYVSLDFRKSRAQVFLGTPREWRQVRQRRPHGWHPAFIDVEDYYSPLDLPWNSFPVGRTRESATLQEKTRLDSVPRGWTVRFGASGDSSDWMYNLHSMGRPDRSPGWAAEPIKIELDLPEITSGLVKIVALIADPFWHPRKELDIDLVCIAGERPQIEIDSLLSAPLLRTQSAMQLVELLGDLRGLLVTKKHHLAVAGPCIRLSFRWLVGPDRDPERTFSELDDISELALLGAQCTGTSLILQQTVCRSFDKCGKNTRSQLCGDFQPQNQPYGDYGEI